MEKVYNPVSPRTRAKIYTNWKAKSNYYKELAQASEEMIPPLSSFSSRNLKRRVPTSNSRKSTNLSKTKSESQLAGFESDYPTDTSSELEVMCTNCYGYIHIDAVDSHSKVCTRPIAQSEEVSLINMQIQKFLESINRKEAKAWGNKKNVLRRIRTIAHHSLTSEETGKLIDSLEEVRSHGHGLSCCIYARKLMHLLEIRKVFSHKQSKQFSMNPQDFLHWKSRTEFLLGLVKKNHSDEQSENQLEDLEKQFYSLCIQRKAELSKSHPKQDLPISLVYERVKEIGISFSKWQEFINLIYS